MISRTQHIQSPTYWGVSRSYNVLFQQMTLLQMHISYGAEREVPRTLRILNKHQKPFLMQETSIS